MLAKALRALAWTGGIAASVAIFVEQGLYAPAESFGRLNAMPGHDRVVLIGAALGVALLAVIAAGSWMWRGGGAAVGGCHDLTHRYAPLVLLAALPAALDARGWDPLTAAAALALFVVLAERTFRMRLQARRRGKALTDTGASRPLTILLGQVLGPARSAIVRRWLPPAVVALAAVGYAAYMATFTVWSHRGFATYGYDLGQYNSVFWSTLHGRPLRCSPLNLTANWSDLSNHADLAVFALLPFYALRPNAETLLIMQSCLLALGAIPIYRFAARRLPGAYAALLALAYLAYPPLHGSNFYDFHFQPIAATFVLATVDFLDERRDWAGTLTFLVALACREDISVGLAFFGAFLALSGRRPIAGLIVAAVSSVYFVAMRFVIMPAFGTWWFADLYDGLGAEGFTGFGGVVATLLSNPPYVFATLLTADKLRYALQILVPVAFLPVRRTYLLAAVIPGAIFTVLTNKYPPTTDISFQYSGHFTAYIFPAAALALRAYRVAPKGSDGGGGATDTVKGGAAIRALLLGTILGTVAWGAIPPRGSFHGGFDDIPMRPPTTGDRQYERDLRVLDARIPAEASVAVSDHELPHLSRMELFTLRDGLFDADYLLYGVESGSLGATNAEQAIAAGKYVTVAEKPGLVLAIRADLREFDKRGR